MKDINHKDKQNFEAVMRITNPSVLKILQQIPDAKGTIEFLRVLRCAIDSFLDETITLLERIHKAWYAIFFFRYWRKWIMKSKEYSIQSNFITKNSYYCVELNAHSSIILLQTARKCGHSFLPRLHDSQSCEQLFRTVRSMCSTFSTIVNFGMLGLLRRLHRLQIQFHLETSSHATGIIYPQTKTTKHNAKCVRNPDDSDLTDVTDQDILAVVWDAKSKVYDAVKELGMWEESIDCDHDNSWQEQEWLNSVTEEADMDETVSENDGINVNEQEPFGKLMIHKIAMKSNKKSTN